MAHRAAAFVDGHEVHPPVDEAWSCAAMTAPSPMLAARSWPCRLGDLGLIETFLLRTEARRSAAADLDHDRHRRRTGVERNDVELITTDTQLPLEDDPALSTEERGDPLFGCVSGSTARRSMIGIRSVCRAAHRAMLNGSACLRLSRPSPGALPAPPGSARFSPKRSPGAGGGRSGANAWRAARSGEQVDQDRNERYEERRQDPEDLAAGGQILATDGIDEHEEPDGDHGQDDEDDDADLWDGHGLPAAAPPDDTASIDRDTFERAFARRAISAAGRDLS